MRSWPLEDNLEKKCVYFPIIFFEGLVVSLHGENFSLAVLLNPLHDHANPADFALPGNQFYFLVFSKLLPNLLDSLVDVDMLHSLELGAFLKDWPYYFITLGHC